MVQMCLPAVFPALLKQLKNPPLLMGLIVNQARLSCSAVQGEVPLLIVPSGQVVLPQIVLVRYDPNAVLSRFAPIRFAPSQLGKHCGSDSSMHCDDQIAVYY